MKTKLILLTSLLSCLLGFAETLPTDAVVFARSDAQSAILARLPAGASITVAGEAPVGWKRVEISGPFVAYAHTQDITKSLDVRPGANLYSAPRKDSPLLTVAAEGDKTEITGLVPGNSDFCQVRLDKKLVGFIAVGATANTPVAQSGAVLTAPTRPTPTTPSAPAPTIGRPTQMGNHTADLPRLFAGTLVLARRLIINPNPPYDYQLVDSSGRRFAYVDLQRLRLKDPIETYLNRELAITGTMRNTVDGQDLVIAAESIQLKK